MSDLTDALLTAVLAYGAPALGLTLLVAALGIPLPATLLLASVAFARQSMLDARVALGLGYAFADQWETLSDLAGNLTGVLIGLLALVVGGALA